MDFISVREAKDCKIIPEQWNACIPDTCSFCGHDIVINSQCTIMKCSNISCYRKLAYQITAFLQDLGYKGVGPETLTAYCQYWNMTSILDYIKNPNVCDLIPLLNSMELSYAHLIELLHIPNFGSKAYKVFEGYSCYAEFDKDMLESGNPFNFLLNIIGGYDTTYMIANILINYVSVLKGITSYVKVFEKKTHIFELAITGHITQIKRKDGSSFTKEEFLRYINTLARPYGLEFRLSSALQSIQMIIADYPSNTRKYNIGKQRNILYSSKELLAMVLKYRLEKENGNGADTKS